jgi:flagellar protein FlbD
MIHLTRLNNSKLIVNSDLIKWIEQSPDTVITLLNGEKILVQEPVHEVVSRVIDFRRQVFAGILTSHPSTSGEPDACSAPGIQTESAG